jgi:hypothetical protein
VIIRLTYPHANLNPNRKLHWAKKSSYVKTYKSIWHTELLPHKSLLKGKSVFRMSMAPPDKRRRDCDNAEASLKPMWDALAIISGIDDSKFRISKLDHFLPPEKNGVIYLEVIE